MYFLVNMRMIDVFSTLGVRLRDFGADAHTAHIIAQAVNANEWFSETDVKMAVDAICQEFLSREKLQQWAAKYDLVTTPRRRVAIIMAGNIPLVGFFDLICVLMCGHEAYVKPSHKDSVLTNYIISELKSIAPDIPIRDYAPATQVDMVIATGGDSAAAHFRRSYADLPTLIRGSRHSVAVLDGGESVAEIEGMQRDIFSYSGLGCRNVSLVFLPRGSELKLSAPENLGEMYRGNYLSQRALMLMSGVDVRDWGFCLSRERREYSDAISCVNYAFYDDLAEVEDWLAANDATLQCVVSHCVKHPRVVPFGRAQYPALDDYADGVDVMKFLIGE